MLHPRKNNQLYGFESEKKTFLTSLANNNLHHAWLITGMPSIGKATFAYHLAKFILAPYFNPDQFYFEAQSATTKKIEALSHPDLYVIDAHYTDGEARSNPLITIDEVRALNRLVHLTTAEAKYRVILIDGIEYMNQNAANGLLKALEEPNKNTLFLMVCNSLAKLLPTIRSRCLTIKVAKPSFENFNNVMRLHNFELNSMQLEELYHISSGNINLAQQLQANDGLKTYAALKELVEHWRLDKLMETAESLHNSAMNWQLTITLINHLLHQKLKRKALSNVANIEQDLVMLDRFNSFLSQGTVYNLDKQHMLLQARAA